MFPFRLIKASFWVLSFMTMLPLVSQACNCQPTEKIDIKTVNDAENIFVAKLLGHARVPQATKLEFELIESIKGKNRKKLTVYIKKHKGMHHVDTLYSDQEWIVFGRFEKVRGKKYFRFTSVSSDFCATSRPLKPNDTYLEFLNDVLANIGKQSYKKDDTIFAIGRLKNGAPVGKWIYSMVANYYWEGQYKKGKRSGWWFYKFSGSSEKTLTLEKWKYKCGNLVGKYVYNYIGELRSEEHHTEDEIRTTFYNNGRVWLKIIKDLETEKTTRINHKGM